MKQIVVISGKGGTGKTTLTAALVSLAERVVVADCDVDAADLHFLLGPEVRERHRFVGGRVPVVDHDLCTECGACADACHWEAIDEHGHVDRLACEGCAVCSHVCPVDAIVMEERVCGEWYVSRTRYGPFIHARLGIAEENSGKLVTQVRKAARETALEQDSSWVFIDGPPGIGCPVIASISGVDLALVVTEPTISGIHDMERVLDVSRHFEVPSAVVINKYDLNEENTRTIEEICRRRAVPILGRIPFSKSVNESVVSCKPMPEFIHDGVTEEIARIWDKIRNDGGRHERD